MPDIAIVVCLALERRAPPDALAQFKACICRCPFVDTTLEVTGTFDLIVQGRCASLAEYAEHLDLLRPQLSQFVTRMDTNFVSRRVDQKSSDAESASLWLPCEGGHKQVDARLINKILAEGDYMRVQFDDWSCLVHTTMRQLRERLDPSQFIQLHRSTLVRIGFIDRLIHRGQAWEARLRDQTVVKVAKSRARDVLQVIGHETSAPNSSLAKPRLAVASGTGTMEAPHVSADVFAS